ncbi:MAG: hypothetical protein NUV59_01920 [Patescibacteria group bacterium]|nr:hypothetical protein [Patescibacteria group bacterium]
MKTRIPPKKALSEKEISDIMDGISLSLFAGAAFLAVTCLLQDTPANEGVILSIRALLVAVMCEGLRIMSRDYKE